jgi:hypothetical protein
MKAYIIISLFIFQSHIALSQESEKKVVRHEIGINAFPFIQHIFINSAPNPFDNTISYRATFSKYGSLRFRFNVTNQQKDPYSYTQVAKKSISFIDAFASHTNSFRAKVGWQWNKDMGHWRFYGGVDINLQTQAYKSGSAYTRIDTSSGAIYLYTYKNTGTSSIKTTGVGISPLIGLSYKLAKKFQLSYEVCLNVDRIVTEQEVHSKAITSTHNNQGVLLTEKSSAYDYSVTRKSRSQAFAPISVLMLSYIF